MRFASVTCLEPVVLARFSTRLTRGKVQRGKMFVGICGSRRPAHRDGPWPFPRTPPTTSINYSLSNKDPHFFIQSFIKYECTALRIMRASRNNYDSGLCRLERVGHLAAWAGTSEGATDDHRHNSQPAFIKVSSSPKKKEKNPGLSEKWSPSGAGDLAIFPERIVCVIVRNTSQSKITTNEDDMISTPSRIIKGNRVKFILVCILLDINKALRKASLAHL